MAARPWFLPDEDTPNLGNGRFRVSVGATIRLNGFSVKYDLTFNVSPQNIKFNDPTITLRNFYSANVMETCSNTASNRMVEMIEKFPDVKTTSDAWPSDLVRKASLTARASLCILRPASNTIII